MPQRRGELNSPVIKIFSGQPKNAAQLRIKALTHSSEEIPTNGMAYMHRQKQSTIIMRCSAPPREFIVSEIYLKPLPP